MAPRKTNQRPDMEAFLTSRGITFEFQSQVSPARFDQERSLRNQARLGVPLNKETVRRYAEDVDNGDQFPPVYASEERGKLVILDGNHRLAAHTEASAPLDVYVCDGPAQALMMLTFEANAKHGLPSSEEDRLHHALFLVDSGMTEREAAIKLGVRKNVLRKAITNQTADRRAVDVGIKPAHWEMIPVTSRQRLAQILTDEGFRAAVELARDAILTSNEIDKIVVHVNESRSGATQAKMVQAVRDEMAERIADAVTGGGTRQGKRAGSPRARLGMAMGQLIGLPGPDAFAAEIPEQLRPDVIKKLDEASDRIAAIKKALS